MPRLDDTEWKGNHRVEDGALERKAKGGGVLILE